MKYINVLFFVFMVVMNYLANALPLGGKTTGELSAAYPNLFVPAGVTFSIWGVIYLMLLGFCLLQFREQNRTLVEAIGWAFALSCLLNGLWIVSWHYRYLPASLLIMLALLMVLIYINYQLRGQSMGLTRAAFGVYLGWISIATIANVTALLVNYNWGGWGMTDVSWAIMLIPAGLLITAFALYRLQNPFIGLAVIWAFIGIYLNRQGDYTSIAITALVAAVIMGAFTLWAFWKLTPYNPVSQ
ncbi:MAG: tryptophan-rich sensory protein [Bacteroidales bacterium]